MLIDVTNCEHNQTYEQAVFTRNKLRLWLLSFWRTRPVNYIFLCINITVIKAFEMNWSEQYEWVEPSTITPLLKTEGHFYKNQQQYIPPNGGNEISDFGMDHTVAWAI